MIFYPLATKAGSRPSFSMHHFQTQAQHVNVKLNFSIYQTSHAIY